VADHTGFLPDRSDVLTDRPGRRLLLGRSSRKVNSTGADCIGDGTGGVGSTGGHPLIVT